MDGVLTGISPVWAIVSAVVTGVGTYLASRSKDSTSIEVAKINANKDSEGDKREIHFLRVELEEMKESYDEVKRKYNDCMSRKEVDNKTLADYRNLIRHYRFIFKLVYEQIVPQLDESSVSHGLLEEVKEMFRDDFKL
jgi:ActR/RegA family two-component response regulator